MILNYIATKNLLYLNSSGYSQGISLTKLSAHMGISWTRIREIFEGSPLSEGEAEKLKQILGIDLTLFNVGEAENASK